MRLSLQPSTDRATYRFAHPVRVRFAETDAMGVVHHASYLAYLEEARVEYLRQAGHPYRELRADGIDLAVLEIAVQFLRSATFDDVVTVHLDVGACTRTTFQIAYLLEVGGSPCATAVSVHGAVDATGRATRLPEWLSGSSRATSPPARSSPAPVDAPTDCT